MNKLLKIGLVSLLALPIVGCGPKESKQENGQTTTEQTTEAPAQKDTSKFDIFTQKKYEEFKFNASGAEYQ